MNLSITTDYASDRGNPHPYLKAIADAGFTHIHWCHHWNTDFMYAQCEIDQIKTWLNNFGLKLLDLHGSVGPEKNWTSALEHERLAGVELVKNRIDMTAQLGGSTVVMHAGNDASSPALRKSFDEVLPFARENGIRIAIENTNNFNVIQALLAEYSPDFLGLCYDSGHGNHFGNGLENLELYKDRLIAVHIHDNDGSGDQHMLPFSGNIDWNKLSGILNNSTYTEPISMEVSMNNHAKMDEVTFLKEAHKAGTRLTKMINS